MRGLRRKVLRIGWVIAVASYLWTVITLVCQWFAPGHMILICFNLFNEAFLEFIVAVVSLAPVSYFFLQGFKMDGRSMRRRFNAN